MMIRVQTDGSIQTNYTTQQPEVWGPIRAIRHALENLNLEFRDLSDQFQSEVKRLEEEQPHLDRGAPLAVGMTPRIHYGM